MPESRRALFAGVRTLSRICASGLGLGIFPSGEIHDFNAKKGTKQGGMAGQPTIYSGQGFSLIRDKKRFVLPNALRTSVRESSGKDVLCLAKHPEWKCLVGFGLSRVEEFEKQLDLEEERADRAGRAFNRDKRAMQLYSFQQVPFDGSGRFVVPEALSGLARIDDQLYFQGVGRFITIWNPAELYALAEDPDMETIVATCRTLADAELAKAAKK